MKGLLHVTDEADVRQSERERLLREVIELSLRLEDASRGPRLMSSPKPVEARKGDTHDKFVALLGRSLRG